MVNKREVCKCLPEARSQTEVRSMKLPGRVVEPETRALSMVNVLNEFPRKHP